MRSKAQARSTTHWWITFCPSPVDRLARRPHGSSSTDLAQGGPELRYLLDRRGRRESPKVRSDARIWCRSHLRGLAERGLTLLCLEDLHAADEAPLELFPLNLRQARVGALVLIPSLAVG